MRPHPALLAAILLIGCGEPAEKTGAASNGQTIGPSASDPFSWTAEDVMGVPRQSAFGRPCGADEDTRFGYTGTNLTVVDRVFDGEVDTRAYRMFQGNRLVAVIRSAPTQVFDVTTYGYDGSGRLSSAQSYYMEPAPPCGSDTECSGSNVCERGVCAPECSSDADCTSGGCSRPGTGRDVCFEDAEQGRLEPVSEDQVTVEWSGPSSFVMRNGRQDISAQWDVVTNSLRLEIREGFAELRFQTAPQINELAMFLAPGVRMEPFEFSAQPLDVKLDGETIVEFVYGPQGIERVLEGGRTDREYLYDCP